MIKSLYLTFMPWTFYGIRPVQISLMRIIGYKADIKNPFMISQRRRPHAFSIDIEPIRQSLCRRTIQPVIYESCMLPVHQIIGAQYFTPRHKMHSRAYHIVCIFHSDDIRVRIIQRRYR